MKNCMIMIFLAGCFACQAAALSLADALALAGRNHPALKQAQMRQKAGDAALKQAGARPNPSLGVEIEDWGRGEQSAVLSQAVEIGGKRKARMARAEADRASARILSAQAETDLQACAYSRYFIAAGLEAESGFMDRSLALAESTGALIERQVALGAAKRVDLLRARTRRAVLENEKRGIEKERVYALSALFSLWGESATGILTDSLRVISMEEFERVSGKTGLGPSVLLKKAEADAMEAEARAADAESWPDLEAGLGLRRPEQGQDPLVTAGVTVGLPVFNRNQGARQEAMQNIGVVRQEAALSAIEEELEIKRLRAAIDNAMASVKTLEAAVLPDAHQVLKELESMTAAGKGSYLELLNAQTELIEFERNRLNSLAELRELLSELARVTGNRAYLIP